MAVTGRTGFASFLRLELDRQEISNRELGRRLDPENHERGRRTVQRALQGRFKPARLTRVRICKALGVPLPDEDDEEELAVALARFVRETVRRELTAA